MGKPQSSSCAHSAWVRPSISIDHGIDGLAAPDVGGAVAVVPVVEMAVTTDEDRRQVSTGLRGHGPDLLRVHIDLGGLELIDRDASSRVSLDELLGTEWEAHLPTPEPSRGASPYGKMPPSVP